MATNDEPERRAFANAVLGGLKDGLALSGRGDYEVHAFAVLAFAERPDGEGVIINLGWSVEEDAAFHPASLLRDVLPVLERDLRRG